MAKDRKLVEPRHENGSEPSEPFSSTSSPLPTSQPPQNIITLSLPDTSIGYAYQICSLLYLNVISSINIEIASVNVRLQTEDKKTENYKIHIVPPSLEIANGVIDFFRATSGIMNNDSPCTGYFTVKQKDTIHKIRVLYSEDSLSDKKSALVQIDRSFSVFIGGQVNLNEQNIPEMAKEHELHKKRIESSSVSARLQKLDDLANSPISNYVRDLFPEIVELERAEAEGRTSWASRVEEKGLAQEPERPPLPEKAPALWAEAKEPGDTPPAFIQRHYAPWLGKGLIRADVRRLDPQLYTALANWLQNPKHTLPDGFDLPTKKESWHADPTGEPPPEVREARRIVSRWNRRQERARSNER